MHTSRGSPKAIRPRRKNAGIAGEYLNILPILRERLANIQDQYLQSLKLIFLEYPYVRFRHQQSLLLVRDRRHQSCVVRRARRKTKGIMVTCMPIPLFLCETTPFTDHGMYMDMRCGPPRRNAQTGGTAVYSDAMVVSLASSLSQLALEPRGNRSAH